jgi:hypothetical protein
LERQRIWRTKIGVLAGAMGTAFVALFFSCAVYLYFSPGPISIVWRDMLIMSAAAVVVIFTGALWSTLLLREIISAFWFTVLIPSALTLIMELLNINHAFLFALLGLYSVAGFFWARRQFLRAQETAWTGGVVTLPGWRAANKSQSTARTHRPLAALFWKELQLYQVSLLGMGCLFILHLGVVLLRKVGHDTVGDLIYQASLKNAS